MYTDLKDFKYKIDEKNKEIHLEKCVFSEDRGEINIAPHYTINKEEYKVTKILNKPVFNLDVESVTIPDTITSIGQNAFSNAQFLTNINVDKNNPRYSSHNGILYNKKGNILIKCPIMYSEDTVNIPGGVTSIRKDAFSKTSNIKTITMTDSVKLLGDSCFSGSTIKNITLSNNIEKLPIRCFNHCYALEKINTPSKLRIIAGGAFNACLTLKEFDIPESIDVIGMRAFTHAALTKIHIPKCLKYLNSESFSNMEMNSVVVPSNIDTINPRTFLDTRIKNMYIGSKLVFDKAYELPDLVNFYYLNNLFINKTEKEFTDYDEVTTLCKKNGVNLIHLLSVDELEAKGFDYGQINQIIKGYDNGLILSGLPMTTDSTLMRDLNSVNSIDEVKALDLVGMLMNEPTLEENIEIYNIIKTTLGNDVEINEEVVR